MKRFIIFCLMHVVLMNIYAQQVSLKSVSLRQSDLLASTQPRTDSNGKNCAIVKVDVIGVNDLEFLDAVGDVDYHLGEYVVYVPEGLKVLKYKNVSGSISGVVDFEEYGLEIETKRVYNVVFETDNHIRAAIFTIQPSNARLIFDGNAVVLDETGIAVVEKPIGTYAYTIEAEGYESINGNIRLIEDNISTIVDVALKQRMIPVTISSNVDNATLFVDNIPYGQLKDLDNLEIPQGKHEIRLTAIGYNNYERDIDLVGEPVSIECNLVQMEQQVIKHKEERTRTSVNRRNPIYLNGGYTYMSYKDPTFHGIQLGVSKVQNFGGIFALREGFYWSAFYPVYSEEFKKLHVDNELEKKINSVFEIPLQVGLSIPLGNKSNNSFSLFGGGYGNIRSTEIFGSNNSENVIDEDFDSWDYGLKVTGIIDINHFSIGIDASKSLNREGFTFAITIGYKGYKIK